MSFLRDLYFFQGQKYTSFGKNILLRQSTSLGHSSTGHPGVLTTDHLAGVVSVADGGHPRQPLAVHRLHLEAAREGGGLAGAEDVVGGGEPDVHDLEGGAAAGRALHLGSDM